MRVASYYRYWTNENFEISDWVERDGTVASAVAIMAEVVDEKVSYMRFMEDTFATARSFRSGCT